MTNFIHGALEFIGLTVAFYCAVGSNRTYVLYCVR